LSSFYILIAIFNQTKDTSIPISYLQQRLRAAVWGRALGEGKLAGMHLAPPPAGTGLCVLLSKR